MPAPRLPTTTLRRVALVTGAAQGIGRAIARRLARDGAALVLNDVPARRPALEALRAELPRAEVLCADVSDEAQVEGMVRDTVRTLGALDVMVANAGISIPAGVVGARAEDVERTLHVNVLGTFFCYKHAARQMIAQGRGGRIIGASSECGKRGYEYMLAYCASKFAVRGMTQSAAAELARHRITVNAYAPGIIDTNIWDVFKPEHDSSPEATAVREVRGLIQTTPVGRIGQPDDVAALVAYLASENSGYMTGQTVRHSSLAPYPSVG
ncbi:hypothetical protein K488DRAFT_57471 [Vararia minispora EC-137]|uniref:Uncharacterized protein n=1 Tax=Vararia minispora EC-137 TaxID=1314806 RepID=A0ACB8QAY3_9AGAM|nr:hypothetical protein K488DRAFT_57471 [Vararia minispora EC-137]